MKQIPHFSHQSEIVPLAQLMCNQDNLRQESTFGQMLEFLKETAMLFSESYIPVMTFIRYGYVISSPLEQLEELQMAAINEIAKFLCEGDNLKEQSNFGQMKELVKELAIIFNKYPTYLAAMIRYSAHLSNQKQQ